jgi:uncharacterized membrane protein SpoIIM required for sporulation
MREAAFIRQNHVRWEEFEKIAKRQQDVNPDKLAELFIQITDDLAFARTQYPESRTTQYLNTLASKVHLEIYKNKREETSRFVTFWKYEIPGVVYETRKLLFYSFLIFTISTIVGAVSSVYDDTFVRLILGDGYVNMTLENIHNGNPTKVYSGQGEWEMFLSITYNNIQVSFLVFAAGIFASLGTGFLLFRNGVMLGAFIMLFYREQQLAQALPVIMLHGTIELTSIVIAGAAGFAMGNGFLFPKTYSRLVAFKTGAVQGMKIVIGLVPFFVIAGFIESFITRYAFMHWSLKTLVIGLSAVLMIWYFLIYPFFLKRHGKF